MNRYTTYYNHYTKGAIIGTKFRYYIGFLSYGVSETVRMKANHFKSVLTNPNLSLYISAKHDITSLPKKLASLLRNFLLNKLLFSFRTIECCAQRLLICFRVAYFIPNELSKFFSLQLVHNFSVIFPPLASMSRSFEVKRALTVNNVTYKNSTYSFRTQTNMQRSLRKCNSNRLRKKKHRI